MNAAACPLSSLIVLPSAAIDQPDGVVFAGDSELGSVGAKCQGGDR